eukprot:CAMPEP_0182856318 /NCGR_PEP_ID=MMETSP0034_2-20130328/2360_1 /TAXON_ID=156128 /ORGANISM="Nephroselmis pyriformis, Strain CCMP717" /LENGTH=63 /DNA_ID=CAMNT_0024987377 /DNA_START=434 /DNA_END=625 /DNA_ORIENTATION=+
MTLLWTFLWRALRKRGTHSCAYLSISSSATPARTSRTHSSEMNLDEVDLERGTPIHLTRNDTA